MPANLENSAVATGLEKVSFHSNPNECSNYHTIALISQASKLMFKIFQARLQQYVNHEHPVVQAGFRKCRRTRDQIANIYWIMEKAREFQKNIYFCFIEQWSQRCTRPLEENPFTLYARNWLRPTEEKIKFRLRII